MSLSYLYKLNQPEHAYAGIRMRTTWTDRRAAGTSLIEASCVMLDQRGRQLAMCDHYAPVTPDKSTERVGHYHGVIDAFGCAVTVVLGRVSPYTAALYFALDTQAKGGLEAVQGSRVSIEAFGCKGERPHGLEEDVYRANLSEFRHSSGLIVAGFLRTGENTWYATHVETPIPPDGVWPIDLLQQHMMAILST